MSIGYSAGGPPCREQSLFSCISSIEPTRPSSIRFASSRFYRMTCWCWQIGLHGKRLPALPAGIERVLRAFAARGTSLQDCSVPDALRCPGPLAVIAKNRSLVGYERANERSNPSKQHAHSPFPSRVPNLNNVAHKETARTPATNNRRMLEPALRETSGSATTALKMHISTRPQIMKQANTSAAGIPRSSESINGRKGQRSMRAFQMAHRRCKFSANNSSVQCYDELTWPSENGSSGWLEVFGPKQNKIRHALDIFQGFN
jgi:hypothetical protein